MSSGAGVVRPRNAYPLCYHADGFVPWEQATLHAGSLALRYGLSVFEGIRVYARADGSGVRPFRLDAHLARLRRSLELTRLPAPAVGDLAGVVAELVRRNRIDEDAYLRVSVSPANPGDLATPAASCLTVTATRMGRKTWLAQARAMRLALSRRQRTSEAVFPAAAKNVSTYAGARLALLEARESGYDGVVLSAPDGGLSEAPTANLFLVKDGRVRTPPLAAGVLAGITRDTVLSLCAKLGVEARAARLTRDDAYAADEAFLCGTGIELAPVASFDDRALPGPTPDAVTPRIIDAYFRLVRAPEAFGAGRATPRPGRATASP